MSKKTKVDVEEVKDEVVEEKPKKEKKFEYHVVVKLNDQVFKTDTNDVAEAIKACEPEFLRTKLIIQVTKGDKTLDRLFFLNEGKRLFTDRIKMEMFIKNLIF